MSDRHGDSSTALPEYVTDDDLLGRALSVAARAHLGQHRNDGAPYLAHPLRVCDLLAEAGAPQSTLAAALLHDAVEDSDLTVGDVVERFGVEVGELVAALTDDPQLDDWVERKDALRRQVAEAGEQAAAIYAADKLAGLREMQDLYSQHGERAIDLHKAPTLDLRVAAWRADAEMVRGVSPRSALVPVLEAELDAFEARRLNETVGGQEAGARG